MADTRRLAEAVRAACLDAAARAYEDAGISGLCHEGRWEIALQAIRTLDLGPVVTAAQSTDGATAGNRSP